MSIINSQPLIGASGQGGGYNLTKSLRFRSNASAYLNRTPASASNRTTWTWSGWVKRGFAGGPNNWAVFFAESGGNTNARLEYLASGQFRWFYQVSGVDTALTVSNALYRDYSAWYHVVFVYDSTQATGANRQILYVNGVQTTNASVITPAQNTVTSINNTVTHWIGRNNTPEYFDGYLAEVNFIDGQALTPSSFGQTSSTTGVWIPKKYTGTYGTNGFYLPFTDVATTSGSNAGLGKDFSGNGNYWTTNNISVTSGSTYDSMTDVPTLTNADTANYAVLNPLKPNGSASIINGNLNISPSGTYCNGLSTIDLDSGSYYAECTVTTAQAMGWGIWSNTASTAVNVGTAPTGFYGIYSGGATLMINGTTPYTNAGASPSNGDIVQVAWSNGKVWFGKNNTWYDSTFGTTGNPSTGSNPTVSSLALNTFTIAFCGANASPVLNANFGQQPFSYTPPTGFKALNTFNLPTPTIGATASTTANEYFDATTYTGTGSSLSITNSGAMQPDLVWIKIRNQAFDHTLVDAVRGTSKDLESNTTGSEQTRSTVTAFNSNGFTVGTDSQVNSNGNTFVAWQWRASNTTAVTNTAGSITSTVSANTTAGFSIATYTGNGSTGATIGHGLGVTPSMVIVKKRSSTGNWITYHTSTGINQYLYLNSTASAATASPTWGVSSTTVTFQQAFSDYNDSGVTYVAYCFAQVAGYSAFGSYTGNGSSDGTFVFTGFRPKYLIVKRTDSTGGWSIKDTLRDPYNSAANELNANLSDAEYANTFPLDIVSNGFKIRSSSLGINANGGTYIYMAFAESPFKYSLAR